MKKTILLLAFLLSTGGGLMADNNCTSGNDCVMCCGNYPKIADQEYCNKLQKGYDEMIEQCKKNKLIIWSNVSNHGCGNYGSNPTCKGNQPYKVIRKSGGPYELKTLPNNTFEY